MSGQLLSKASLKVALSEERLAAYSLESDADELDCVARYLWNAAPSLLALPHGVTNYIHGGSTP